MLQSSFSIYNAQAKRLRRLGFEKLINGNHKEYVGNFINFADHERNFSQFPTHLENNTLSTLIVAGPKTANPNQQMHMIGGHCEIPWYALDDIKLTLFAEKTVPNKFFYPIFGIRLIEPSQLESGFFFSGVIKIKKGDYLFACTAEEGIALAAQMPELITDTPIRLGGTLDGQHQKILLSKKNNKITLWKPFLDRNPDNYLVLACAVRNNYFLTRKNTSMKTNRAHDYELHKHIHIIKWRPPFGSGRILKCHDCKEIFPLWEQDKTLLIQEEQYSYGTNWTENYIPCPKCKKRVPLSNSLDNEKLIKKMAKRTKPALKT